MAPVSYQAAANGLLAPVRGRYVLLGNCEVGFALEGHDRSRPLVIDPVLVYSTYLGGMGSGDDAGYAIAMDGEGSAYVTGRTNSADFPIADPPRPAHPPGDDVFVAS